MAAFFSDAYSARKKQGNWQVYILYSFVFLLFKILFKDPLWSSVGGFSAKKQTESNIMQSEMQQVEHVKLISHLFILPIIGICCTHWTGNARLSSSFKLQVLNVFVYILYKRFVHFYLFKCSLLGPTMKSFFWVCSEK